MKALGWVIEHWLVVRWVIFAVVVGSVWGTLTTVLADDPFFGFDSQHCFTGLVQFLLWLGHWLVFRPALGCQSPGESPESKPRHLRGSHLDDRVVDLEHGNNGGVLGGCGVLSLHVCSLRCCVRYHHFTSERSGRHDASTLPR